MLIMPTKRTRLEAGKSLRLLKQHLRSLSNKGYVATYSRLMESGDEELARAANTVYFHFRNNGKPEGFEALLHKHGHGNEITNNSRELEKRASIILARYYPKKSGKIQKIATAEALLSHEDEEARFIFSKFARAISTSSNKKVLAAQLDRWLARRGHGGTDYWHRSTDRIALDILHNGKYPGIKGTKSQGSQSDWLKVLKSRGIKFCDWSGPLREDPELALLWAHLHWEHGLYRKSFQNDILPDKKIGRLAQRVSAKYEPEWLGGWLSKFAPHIEFDVEPAQK